jgi:hypothetical protein
MKTQDRAPQGLSPHEGLPATGEHIHPGCLQHADFLQMTAFSFSTSPPSKMELRKYVR